MFIYVLFYWYKWNKSVKCKLPLSWGVFLSIVILNLLKDSSLLFLTLLYSKLKKDYVDINFFNLWHSNSKVYQLFPLHIVQDDLYSIKAFMNKVNLMYSTRKRLNIDKITAESHLFFSIFFPQKNWFLDS